MRSVKNLALCALLLLSLGVPSCSGPHFRNYGRITPVGMDAQELASGGVRPELRYYTSGSDLYPNALIGLHRDYRLDPETLWKEVAMTPQKLREVVRFMKAKASEFNQSPYEFELVGTKGEKIGFWYSLLTESTFLRFEKDGTVMLPSPNLDIYEKLEPKEGKD